MKGNDDERGIQKQNYICLDLVTINKYFKPEQTTNLVIQ